MLLDFWYGLWENEFKWQTIARMMTPHVRALAQTRNDLITVHKCDKRRLKCKRVMYNITAANEDDGNDDDGSADADANVNSSKNNNTKRWVGERNKSNKLPTYE